MAAGSWMCSVCGTECGAGTSMCANCGSLRPGAAADTGTTFFSAGGHAAVAKGTVVSIPTIDSKAAVAGTKLAATRKRISSSTLWTWALVGITVVVMYVALKTEHRGLIALWYFIVGAWFAHEILKTCFGWNGHRAVTGIVSMQQHAADAHQVRGSGAAGTTMNIQPTKGRESVVVFRVQVPEPAQGEAAFNTFEVSTDRNFFVQEGDQVSLVGNVILNHTSQTRFAVVKTTYMNKLVVIVGVPGIFCLFFFLFMTKFQVAQDITIFFMIVAFVGFPLAAFIRSVTGRSRLKKAVAQLCVAWRLQTFAAPSGIVEGITSLQHYPRNFVGMHAREPVNRSIFRMALFDGDGKGVGRLVMECERIYARPGDWVTCTGTYTTGDVGHPEVVSILTA